MEMAKNSHKEPAWSMPTSQNHSHHQHPDCAAQATPVTTSALTGIRSPQLARSSLDARTREKHLEEGSNPPRARINVHVGFINEPVIKTNGGPKIINKCTYNKDKHPPPLLNFPEKNQKKKKERKERKERRDSQANSKTIPGDAGEACCFLPKSKLQTFPKFKFPYMSLV